MIDLDPIYLAQIKSILKKHLPGITVKVFGSRVTGKAKLYSDLDLAIIAKNAITVDKLNEVKFAFSNSNLPIMVDIVDWHDLSKKFQKIIDAESQPLI